MPAAYHGRSSSVIVSGTPVHRPKGQFRVDGTGVSGLCQKLDFEVEFAAFIGQGNELGRAIDVRVCLVERLVRTRLPKARNVPIQL